MAVLVGTLAVDVVNGQATFKLDDAKSHLDSFGRKAGETGRRVSGSMRESREAVEAVADMFGVHLPSAITRTVAGLETLGPALATALPFAAIALGAALLVEHFHKVKEAAEKLKESEEQAGIAAQKTFNQLGDKIIEAEKKTDELRGDHLGALKKELELIDHQSLNELMTTFDQFGKEAEGIMKQLSGTWYLFQSGSEGAQASFTRFKLAYDSLLAKRDEAGAKQLLSDTVAREEQVLSLMKEAMNTQVDYNKREADFVQLRKMGVDVALVGKGITDKQIEGEEALVNALRNQVQATKEVNQLKNIDTTNAKTEYTEKYETIHVKPPDTKAYEESVRKRKEAEERLGEDQIKANEAVTKAIADEDKKHEHLAAMSAGIEHDEATGAAEVEAAKKRAELDKDYKLGLVSIQAYVSQKKDLLTQDRDSDLKLLNDQKTAALERAKLAADKGDYAAETAALNEVDRLTKEITKETIKWDKAFTEVDTSLQELYPTWHQGFTKMVNDMEKTLPNAAGVMARSLQQGIGGFSQSMARSLVEGKNLGTEMRQVAAHILESWVEMAVKRIVLDEMVTAAHVSGNAQQAASDATTSEKGKVKDAGTAARKAFVAGWHFPFPVNIVMAPLLAAGAFATAMAFAGGGIVPGYGNGDSVPSVLTPGEMVLPKPISQGLQGAIQNGGLGGNTHIEGGDIHLHASALDSAGLDRVLKQHAKTIHKHVMNEMRKHNK